jgi:exopolysaccharide biosynthesis protein
MGVSQADSDWQQLDHGLELGKFQAPLPSRFGDRKITILRIDPAHWKFRLLTAADHDKRARTAREWASNYGLTAVVNAGMFQMDGLSNVGYMKVDGKVHNSHFNDDNTIVVFGTDAPAQPQFQIIDRECQNWKSLVDVYENATQGIRMVDCKQQNRWSQQPRSWSMVVIGMDKSGRALFISCRSPYTVHDFIEMLLQLDIHLKNAMYLEGGPESSFFLKTADCEVEQYGSFETGFFESDGNNRAWPIPNVIGISPR